MGDISAEPSMEDILSSIKRIIAEENDAPARAKRPAARPLPKPEPEPFGHDEILELSEHAPEPVPQPAREAVCEPSADPLPAPTASASASSSAASSSSDAILSPRTAEASRGPLDALSRLVVKPETNGSDTLEGMVREMLRPMLREWLDANLPAMVETMVAREIDRITGK